MGCDFLTNRFGVLGIRRKLEVFGICLARCLGVLHLLFGLGEPVHCLGRGWIPTCGFPEPARGGFVIAFLEVELARLQFLRCLERVERVDLLLQAGIFFRRLLLLLLSLAQLFLFAVLKLSGRGGFLRRNEANCRGGG